MGTMATQITPHKWPVTRNVSNAENVSIWWRHHALLAQRFHDRQHLSLGLATALATENWVNIGLGNGLLTDGTKPLPEPMLTYRERGWGGGGVGGWGGSYPPKNNFIEISQNINSKKSSKISKLLPPIPGVNELTNEFQSQAMALSTWYGSARMRHILTQTLSITKFSLIKDC